MALLHTQKAEKSPAQSFSAVGTVDNSGWIINGEGAVLHCRSILNLYASIAGPSSAGHLDDSPKCLQARFQVP